MKIMTIVDTNSQIIKLSLTINKLSKHCNHILVHTGRNSDDGGNPFLCKDLDLKEPDYYLAIQADTAGEQIGKILIEIEKTIIAENPDRILIIGGTNSGLVSIIAKRMGIDVFHIEAGKRCFDERIPEEINRIVTDHCSTVLLPCTYKSGENLLKEGISNRVIHVIGSPIYEVITHYSQEIDASKILDRLGLKAKRYFLVNMHQEENINDEYKLKSTFTGLDRINIEYDLPIICCLPQKTRDKITQCTLQITNKNIHILETFRFFDFVHLEKNATCIITDSGAVQEECCILGTPNITIREVTERPETIECGSTMLASTSPKVMLKSVEIALNEKHKWKPPPEYLDDNVSSKIVKIVLGYLDKPRATEYS